MTPKLSEEIEQAITNDPTGIVRVEGANGTYYVMTEEAIHVRQQVQLGLDALDRGESSDWNADDIIAKAQNLREQRTA